MRTPDEDKGANDAALSDNDSDDEEDEAIDMDEFEESGMLQLVDPAVATTTRKLDSESEIKKSSSAEAAGGSDATDSVLHTRTYDLHITYDKYYQTPRLWVVGYDEVSLFFFILFILEKY